MAITYMKRRESGIYEFRRMLPRSLAGMQVPPYALPALDELRNPKTGRFKLELTVSLKTADLTDAKKACAREQARVAVLMESALSTLAAGPPPDTSREAPDLVRLEAELVAGLLRADEEERQQGDDRRHLQTAEERERWPDLTQIRPAGAMGMELDHYHAKGEEIAELLRDYRMALARQDARIVEPELNAWLRKNGRTTDTDIPWRPLAAMRALKAHVTAYGLLDARQRGDDVPTPEIAAPLPAAPQPRGILLSEALRLWQEGGTTRGAKKPTARSVEVTEQAVRRFTEVHGDLPLGAINFEKARSFRDAYAAMPIRLTTAMRKLTLPKLLALPKSKEHETPHTATVNKLMGMLGAVVSAAEKEGLTDHLVGFQNPFGKRIKLQVDDRGELRREPFTAAELTRIFQTPVYAANARPAGGGGEGAYWLPLIALLSGARQNEIAELRLQDLAQDPDTGVWHFDISTEGGRTIKTASSRRKVPVHPALEAVGLLRYREEALRQSKGDASKPLWPDILEDSAGRRAGSWSKWFNRYLHKDAGVTGTAKVFHSFRHTFKRLARDAKVSEELHDALTGHAPLTAGQAYGRGAGLPTMLEAISAIVPPPVVLSLRWGPGSWRPKAKPRPTAKQKRPRPPQREKAGSVSRGKRRRSASPS